MDKPSKSLKLNGQVSHLKNYNGKLALIKQGTELVILELAGVAGLKVVATIYQKFDPFNSFTFFSTVGSVNKDMFVTGSSTDKLFQYSTTPNMTYNNIDISCR